MQYLAAAMRFSLFIIGIYLMYTSTTHPSTECLAGLAITITAVYLCLQSKFGAKFTECNIGFKKTPKKKGFFS